ncbi:3-deoxy-D-manno-octulosonic acid transferase [Vibrio sp. T187]|uniref:lipid IV(A) 3-deoxy-D-manno-octulosonic acid transferase n=1 Tax=Vibrio TaxID=662 RepID=UPI0010C96648|nr:MULTISPECIES: lipid IV(A) 3-deoxy-D-manno-octulosonic acid transferase [Vibrio]MBW3697594.1 3-deoxy-D-manno-octulosonic acid transferase [Vibrio sp. T187]
MLIRSLYTIVLFLVSPILLFGLYRSKPNKPKFGKRWKEHFGLIDELNSKEQPIWIHAVSVGECIAATPLIKALKDQNATQPILVTTTTSTGAEQIAKLGNLVEHRYMPIDFGFAIRAFLKAAQPCKMLIIETELWPNTLYEVKKRGIPITVVNARLSQKSRDNYARFKPIFNIIEPCLTQVLCQHQTDAENFQSLDVAGNKLKVTGSIKFDIEVPEQSKLFGIELRQKLGGDRPIWIAASTHKGEDIIALNAHKQVLEHNPDAILILVPRHPERFNDVFDLCENEGFKTTRRTTAAPLEKNIQVFLGDTIGEMITFLAASDVCFMGGSLVGKEVGGHNVLEPAALGIPIITGPSYYNFSFIVEALTDINAIQVSTSNSLGSDICSLIDTHKERNNQSQKLLKFMAENSGSLDKTITFVNEY